MDDKYTKFPNEMLERFLLQKFTASQMAVFICVLRKTYGWGKGTFGDSISLSSIARETNYSRTAISNAVGDLEKMGVLEIERGGHGKIPNIRIRETEYWDM